jgi:hypothetical protein
MNGIASVVFDSITSPSCVLSHPTPGRIGLDIEALSDIADR